jgi:hypothetical protein
MSEINKFLSFLKSNLENQNISSKLDEMMIKKSSTAGSTSKEEVFTREFLCPTIHNYFSSYIRQSLSLSDEDIKRGLGTEGFQNAPGFGYSPARQLRHFFTKSDFVKSSPPQGWFDQTKQPPKYQACPDFSLRSPLPFSAIGEVKYFRKGSVDAAMKELFNDLRQAAFYLGAYRKDYDSAILLIADETPGKTMEKCVAKLHPDILSRFGEETGIYLVVISL